MERQQRVAAVILAAGESRRFGSPKQLARLGERTLLEHVLDLARRAELDPIIAVVPVWWMGDDDSVTWVQNPSPELGMSHSLRLGLGALPADVPAALILLGDQPTLRPEAVRALVAARGARPIVATRVAGLLGAPVLLDRTQFGLVERLSGDIGLREVVMGHPNLVNAVDMPVPAPDVDTPDDLRQLTGGRNEL